MTLRTYLHSFRVLERRKSFSKSGKHAAQLDILEELAYVGRAECMRIGDRMGQRGQRGQNVLYLVLNVA